MSHHTIQGEDRHGRTPLSLVPEELGLIFVNSLMQGCTQLTMALLPFLTLMSSISAQLISYSSASECSLPLSSERYSQELWMCNTDKRFKAIKDKPCSGGSLAMYLIFDLSTLRGPSCIQISMKCFIFPAVPIVLLLR